MCTINDFMQMAIEEAKLSLISDDIPIGAIIVHNKKIIAKAHNQVQKLNNPLAHAEIDAINQAIDYLGDKYLYNCQMYVNLEPCPMCAGAIVLARIGRLYIGTESTKMGACGSIFNIVQEEKLNHYTEVYFGIGREASAKIVSDFFNKLRIKNKNIDV